jgi:hypothetical protein
MKEIKGFAKRERFNNESKKFCKKKEVLPRDKSLKSKHD